MNKKSYLKKIALSTCVTSLFCLYLLEGRAAPEEAPAPAPQAASQPKPPAAPAQAEAPALTEPAEKPAQAQGEAPAQAAPAATEKAPEAATEPAPPQLLAGSGVQLLTKEKSLYVDLAREIEISERERGRIEALQDKGYQANIFATELKSRLDELNKLKAQLNTTVSEVGSDIKKGEQGNEKLQLLVSLYESLSPDQAAGLMKRLPITVSLAMIQMMNPKKSSKIIAAMEPKIAAEISQRLIRSSKIEIKGGTP